MQPNLAFKIIYTSQYLYNLYAIWNVFSVQWIGRIIED